MAGGYTMSLPSEDRSYRSKREMEEDIVVLLGGRVAESIVLGDISTGASNDIERATKLANAMVTKYGMSDKLGPINYGADNTEVFIGKDMGHTKNYSEKIAAEIDTEMRSIITNAYNRTEKILLDNRDKLEELAMYLFTKEKVSAEEFEDIMKGKLPKEDSQDNELSNEDSNNIK